MATSSKSPEAVIGSRIALLSILTGCAADAGPPAAGVVMICMDTLRADHVGAWGQVDGLTPNLDRLAAQSIRYEHAFAQANETILSHTSLFTSRYPSEVADFRAAGLPQGTPTLAGRLHGAGWETAAIVAGGHLSRAYGLNSGFDHYDDTLDWGSLAETGPRALHWLDQRSSTDPFLLFVHGYDTHDRYLKPSPFGYSHADQTYRGLGRDLGQQPGAISQVADRVWVGGADELVLWARDRPRFARGAGAAQLDGAQPLTPADIEHLGQLYAGSVAWADAALGLFLGGLEERGILEDSWLVVLSDHGHELGTHGFFHHRFALTDDTLHVPLLIRPPGGRASAYVETGLVDLLDVAPTLLALAQAPADPEARGQSLFANGQPRSPDRAATFAEGRLRLLSARNRTGTRLTAEGLSTDHPALIELLRDTPTGGAAFSVSGDATHGPALHTALVQWRSQLSGATP